jgi:lipopolysaccharide biosynthesis regulator YciM
MSGKIFTALNKTEADQHWSKGRLNEALDIYETLLNASPNMTLNTRLAIEANVKRLRNELGTAVPQDGNSDVDRAVQKLQSAMATDKTVVDLRRGAKKYYQQGRFAAALENLRLLVRQNAADEFCVTAVAGCIIHLYRIEELAVATDLFITTSFESAKKASLFKMMLADKMANKGYHKHAEELTRHRCCFTSTMSSS